jgi:uncharacterized protein (DUF4213/DUF364 family)
MNTTRGKLIEYISPLAQSAIVADVRIGLGYTAVQLRSGHVGLGWTSGSEARCCTHLAQAGTLADRPAIELLEMLADSGNALARTVGLAAANALLAVLPRPEIHKKDVLSYLRITASDHVAMVGYFGPLLPELRKSGCKLDIIELKPDYHGTLSPEAGRASLGHCSVAIITSTTLVTGTCDEILSDLGNPRAVVILGPSAPMCPQVFDDTPVTQISGAWVRDAGAVLRIVSEGGGTQLLKHHLDFATVELPVKS